MTQSNSLIIEIVANDYKPALLNEEQRACPTQVITDFFRQCSLEYVLRVLCDFLDAGIGYDGNYPDGFTPWQAWMTYNQVLCLAEAGWWLYGGKQEQAGASILVQQEGATDVLIA